MNNRNCIKRQKSATFFFKKFKHKYTNEKIINNNKNI